MGTYATFDAVNKLIVLDKIAPVAGVVNIDSQIDLYSDAKEDWQASTELQKFPFPFADSFGGNVLSATQNAGDYYQLKNDDGWRVRPYEADHDLNISGNLYPIDPALPIIVPTSGGFTVLARLDTSSKSLVNDVDVDQIFNAVASTPVAGSYGELIQETHTNTGLGGRIHIHPSEGSSTFPGTILQPVKTVGQAITIASTTSIDVFHIMEDITVSEDVSNFTLEGSHAAKSEITVTTSAITQFTQLINCSLKGTLNGYVIVRDSLIEDVFDFKGIMHNVMINAGGFALASSATPSHMLECYSGKTGEITPEISFANNTTDLGVRGYIGGHKFTNSNKSANNISVDLSSGQSILDSSVIAGKWVIRGVGKAIDDAGNALETGPWNGATLLVETVESKFAKEAWKILGLDPNDPVTDTLTRRFVNSSSIVQVRSGDPDTSITQTRQ